MKKTNFYLSLILCFQIIFMPSCIYTKTKESHDAKLDEISFASKKNLYEYQNENYKLDLVFLTPSQLPLEAFFKNLKRGKLKKSIESINLIYEPSNYSNKAIEMLNEEGFTPLLVKITNTGTKTLEFDEKSFMLVNNSKESLAAFYSDALPQQLERFNSKALAANIYNTSVVVIGFASLMGLLYIGLMNDVALPSDSGTKSNDKFFNALNDNHTYNPLYTNVAINYKNLLISKTQIKPQETVSGLLFFYDQEEKFETVQRIEFNFKSL